MFAAGKERTYQLYLPNGYDAQTPHAVVVDFHGRGSSADQKRSLSNFLDIADREGVVLLWPQGEGGAWSLSSQAGDADVAFVRELLDVSQATLCIDTSRIYLTGISMGGMQSTVLACQLADRIAAIAPVAGMLFPGAACDQRQPVPIQVVHGTDDLVVPFEVVDGAVAGWAMHYGCDELPSSTRGGEVAKYVWSNCATDVELLVVEGGGHNWPGNQNLIDILPELAPAAVRAIGHISTELDATQSMWEFFRRHRR